MLVGRFVVAPGAFGGCLAVSWSDKHNARLCFIFVTQKIAGAWMRSRGWRHVIRPARAVRIISLISYRRTEREMEGEMERAGETLPQPTVIIRMNGMGAEDVLLNGCCTNGSKEKKVTD